MPRLRTLPAAALALYSLLSGCSRPARNSKTGPGPTTPAVAPPAAPGGLLARFGKPTFHGWPVADRQQGGLAVGYFAVPDGWNAAARTEWAYANSSWPFQWSAKIAAPDGSAWLETYPAECFYWLEPPDRSTRVGAKSLGMIHRPGIGAKDAMTWLIARARPGARNFHVVGFRPIPNLAVALGKPAFPGDSVAARVRYEQDGHPVDEEFFLVLGGNRIPYHGPQGTSYENHRILAYAHSMGARDGRLDALHPLLGFIVSSFRPDPAWERRRDEVQAQLTAQFNRNLAAGYSQIAAAGALSRQISANNDRMIASMDAQRASRNAAMDRVNDNFSQYIRGTERMQDPYWGTSEHSYTEKYHWTDGQGGYQHSNDAGFNPNAGGTGNWQLMQPAK
ncbi:MAG: hypothetical protein IPL89_10245 [Acidobacteria bacterium]|nr:hypothetical protein [Acidobacteriota bacterium]